MSKTKEETVQQWRESLAESARLAVEALSAITPINMPPASTDEACTILGQAIPRIRELVRPAPKSVAFLEEAAWYRMKGAANPPLNIPPAAEQIGPSAPQMVPGEDRYMSRPEAIYILGKLATSRRINVDGVIALQMGARALFKRHFDRQRNWARRRERAAEDSKRTTASAEQEQEAQA